MRMKLLLRRATLPILKVAGSGWLTPGWIRLSSFVAEVVMRAYLFAAILLSALPLAAQAKHPFTFEDMMALKRVEEPVPSPDGKWVLFAAVDVDLTANTKTPHVWVVPLSGNPDNDAHVSQNQGNVGHPSGEREIISDQDADRPR